MSEPLHWLMSVTRSGELLVNVPLPGTQGSRAHSRVTVVVEDVTPPLIVFTTVMSHVIAVVAPPGPGPTLLHWASATFAAPATPVGITAAVRKNAVPRTTTARSTGRQPKLRVGRCSEINDDVCISHSLREACKPHPGNWARVESEGLVRVS